MGIGTKLLDAAGHLLKGFGTGVSGAADALSKDSRTAASLAVIPVQVLPEQPPIDDKKPARPNWDGGFGPIFTDGSGKIEKAQTGLINIADLTLFTLSKSDPVTFSIIDVYKNRITEMGHCVVPDVDRQKSELLLWEKEAMLSISPLAKGVAKPTYESTFLPPAIANELRGQLKALKPDDAQGRKKVRWLIDWADHQVRKELIPRAHKAEALLQGCNGDFVNPFQALNEQTIDDLCTYDAGAIGGTYTRIGDLSTLYHMPGQEIRIYRNPDFSTPQPPFRAYSWEVNGRNIADFTTDDLLYIMRNPQANGYGFSPLKAAAYIIQGSLNADAYNIENFQSNLPPGILELGNLSPEQRERFKVFWRTEVTGKAAGRHKLFMSNFGLAKDAFISMIGKSNTDMQYMEYLEWTLLIKCMCFGVSPQEIGFTKFFKYETSTNQVKMTNRGVEDMAKFLEGVYTEGILKRMMGMEGLKFQFKRSSTMINEEATKTAAARIESGLATQNEIREEWGQRPLPEGGDIAAITTRQGITPVAEIGSEMPGAGESAQAPGPGEEPTPDDLDEAVAALQAAANAGKKQPGQAPQPAAGNQTPKDKAEKAFRILTNHLAKKLGIDAAEPDGAKGHGPRIKGARRRRNVQLRAFRKDIGQRAAKAAAETSASLKKLLKGDS